MESKHTRGTWVVSGDDVVVNHVNECLVIARVEPQGEETVSNAALIAAAPDMYAALMETADRLSAWSDSLRDWVRYDHGTPEKREEWTNEADNYDRLLALIMPALDKADGR